jgi:Integrase zinc binding domain
MKWRLGLSDFVFSVRYLPGKDNAAADAMSRLETHGIDPDPWDQDIPKLLVGLQLILAVETKLLISIRCEEMRQAQLTDKFFQEVLKHGSMFGHKVIEDGDGLIVRVVERVGIADTNQVVVPECLRKRVVELSHQPHASAHPGMSRLFWFLRTGFIWPGMSADVTKHANTCPSCCQTRLKKQRRTHHLKPFTPSAPLEQVAVDILGPLPKTKRGHQYVLVVTDRYSKLA